MKRLVIAAIGLLIMVLLVEVGARFIDSVGVSHFLNMQRTMSEE